MGIRLIQVEWVAGSPGEFLYATGNTDGTFDRRTFDDVDSLSSAISADVVAMERDRIQTIAERIETLQAEIEMLGS